MTRTATHLAKGKYRVGELLARGGYGRVYKGLQVDLEREVAIKILDVPPGEDPLAARRFVEEARLTAQLTHPNIVTILELGEEGGVPWIAYELLPGESIKDLLDEERKLSWPRAREVMLQVASALETAHAKGIIHRDIKSENVLVAGKNLYKVADFGIGKWLGQERVKTAAGMLVGTPAYMAPEVILARDIQPAADFYSLGILLYEMVVGRLPVDSSNLAKALRWHLEGEVPKPTDADPDLPARVDHVVAGLLRKDPAKRVQRLADLRELCQEAVVIDGGSRRPSRVGPREETPRETLRPGRTVSMGGKGEALPSTASRPPPPASRITGPAMGAMTLLVLLAIGLVAADVMRPRPADTTQIVSPSPVPSPAVAREPAPRIQVALSKDAARPVSLELVRIPGGTFRMGEEDRPDTNPDTRATPIHDVTVRPFYLGIYELTRDQYAAISDQPPPRPDGARRPALVQFSEAEKLLAGLRRRTNLPFRLPSEAEWEMACRAGSITDYSYGNDPRDFDRYGWAATKDARQFREPVPVGRFKSNKFGLFDMMGNCTEWVSDGWHPDYTGAPTDGSSWDGSPNPARHVSRGGSTNNVAESCRCARRTTPISETFLMEFVDHTMRVALDGDAAVDPPP